MLRAAWEGLVEADVSPQVRLQTLNHLLLEHASYEEFFATVCSAVIAADVERPPLRSLAIRHPFCSTLARRSISPCQRACHLASAT